MAHLLTPSISLLLPPDFANKRQDKTPQLLHGGIINQSVFCWCFQTGETEQVRQTLHDLLKCIYYNPGQKFDPIVGHY